MSSRKTELDIDFIGGNGSLSTEEEKALSNFFKQLKMNSEIKGAKQNIEKRKKAA